jgi:hypothetical protein
VNAHRATAVDAFHVPLSAAQKLSQDAAAATEVRTLQMHPDVVALGVEKVRRQVDGLMWVGIVLGLGFTMVNVQTFAAAGAALWSLAWLAAWLLDPMVSLVLIAVIRAEQVTARWQVAGGGWATRTKWATFAATFAMNTWASWSAGNAAGIVLHSVPPILVFAAAETAPVLRDRLTSAVATAADTLRSTAAGDVTTETAGPSATEAPTVRLDEAAETPAEPPARPAAGRPARPVPSARPARPVRSADRTAEAAGPDVSDLMPAALQIAAELRSQGKSVTRDRLVEGLRARDLGVGGDRKTAIYAAVRDFLNDEAAA